MASRPPGGQLAVPACYAPALLCGPARGQGAKPGLRRGPRPCR
jgi:hypothetical protein